MSAFGQNNAKAFPRKLRWGWNYECLAQRIFPRLRYLLHTIDIVLVRHTIRNKASLCVWCAWFRNLKLVSSHSQKCVSTIYNNLHLLKLSSPVYMLSISCFVLLFRMLLKCVSSSWHVTLLKYTSLLWLWPRQTDVGINISLIFIS